MSDLPVWTKTTPPWPKPTTAAPDMEEIERDMWDGGQCETTDGCLTDPDGVCEHGHPSWLLKWRMI